MLSYLVVVSALFTSITFACVLVEFFSIVCGLLLFLMGHFHLLFFAEVVMSGRKMGVIPRAVSGGCVLGELFSVGRGVCGQGAGFGLG